MSNKITYIIPIHKFDKSVEELYPRALQSIKDTKAKSTAIIVVGPKDVLEKVEALSTKKEAKFVENTGSTDFFTQVNTAVMQCTTKYFCVVEYDDTVVEYWPEVAEQYIAASKASVLLPLDEYVKDGKWVSFGNEMAWDTSFADELGHVDMESLKTFMDFNVTGAIINTEDFIKIGMLKPSLRVAAWYEFLLRACHNSLVVYVAPKIGYTHTIEREGSYLVESAKEISQEEGKWLIETARQEFYFKTDRNRKFGDGVQNVEEEKKEE